jgi:orotate phosphoribosyltransferase-like protein
MALITSLSITVNSKVANGDGTFSINYTVKDQANNVLAASITTTLPTIADCFASIRKTCAAIVQQNIQSVNDLPTVPFTLSYAAKDLV